MTNGQERWIDRFWFPRWPATRLSALRWLIGGYALWYVGVRYDLYMRIAGGDPDLFEPVGVARLLEVPLPLSVFQLLLIGTLALNVLFVLGAWFRVTGPLFAGALLTLLCYRNSWSMIYHTDNLVVAHVLAMGLARSADAWSIDAWRRRRALDEPEHGRYGWPIRLMCAVTTLGYCLAGIAKIAGEAGWGWAGGTILRSQITRDALRKELMEGGGPQLAFLLYEFTGLLTFIAVVSLLLELLAPVILFSRRLAYAWVLMVFGMHWGIYFIMGIKFRYHQSGIVFTTFLPIELVPIMGIAAWHAVRTRINARRGAAALTGR